MTSVIKQLIILHYLKYNKKPEKNEILEKFKSVISEKNLETEIHIHKLYNNINYTFEKKNDFIDFLTIVRNGEFYYSRIFPNIYKNICKNLNARFFIYENNSTDKTKSILNKLSNNHNNIFIKCENLVILPENRINKIILARNNLKEFYLEEFFKNPVKNKYIVLFDTDILFNFEITINRLLNEIKINDYSMLLSYGIFAGHTELLTSTLLKKSNFNKEEITYINLMLKYYYDTLALDYGEYFKKNTVNYFKNKHLIDVKTGFGGVALIKKGFYITSKYDNFKRDFNFKNKYIKEDMLCEHWGFSERIKNFGKIYIVRSAECLWYQDRDIYKNDFKFYVKFFINNKGFNNIYK